MEITKAEEKDIDTVYNIVKKTVDEVYRKCYNAEIAAFFMRIHSKENIEKDIKNGSVYLVSVNGAFAGTGTYRENYITRLYILPRFEHMGIGSALMDMFEDRISQNYSSVSVDPSAIAVPFYEKRGYKLKKHEEFPLSEKTNLVHDTYEKPL